MHGHNGDSFLVKNLGVYSKSYKCLFSVIPVIYLLWDQMLS